MEMMAQDFNEWAASTEFDVTTTKTENRSEKVSHGLNERGVTMNTGCGVTKLIRTASATLPKGGRVDFTHQEYVKWAGDAHSRYLLNFESFGYPTEINGNLVLVDEKGQELTPWARDRIIRNALEEKFCLLFSNDEIESTIPRMKINNIDLVDNTMRITLENDDGPFVSFCGDLLAEANSMPKLDRLHSSSSRGTWRTLRLYKTTSGKFVAHAINHSQRYGEHTKYRSEVCDDKEQVFTFFGNDWLANVLYDKAKMEDEHELQ